MQILSSRDEAFSADGKAIWESTSSVLCNSTGNVQLEATSSSLGLGGYERSDTKKSSPVFGSRHKSRSNNGIGQRRALRRRPYPWQMDRSFIRYEFQTDRYLAYRDRAKESNEQIWSKDVEDCFQYGTHLSFHLLESRISLTTCKR
jgi:hypothetical protein